MTRPSKRRPAFIFVFAVFAAIGCTTVFTDRASADSLGVQLESASDLPPGLKGRLHGKVVFERPDGIYIQELGTTQAKMLLNGGRYPRWSPDGTRVASIQGNMLVVTRISDKSNQRLIRINKPRALAWYPDGSALLYSDGRALKKVNLDTGSSAVLASSGPYFELDIGASGDLILATTKGKVGIGWQVRGIDLRENNEWKVAPGCSASLSPDGRYATNLLSSHQILQFHDVELREFVGQISAPGGLKFDNHFWSNHPDWIASESEGKSRDIYAHNIHSDIAYRITSTGDAGRPDIYIDRD
jgi:hypothetical protein